MIAKNCAPAKARTMIANICVVLLEEGHYEGKGGIVARQASIPSERHRPRLPK